MFPVRILGEIAQTVAKAAITTAASFVVGRQLSQRFPESITTTTTDHIVAIPQVLIATDMKEAVNGK